MKKIKSLIRKILFKKYFVTLTEDRVGSSFTECRILINHWNAIDAFEVALKAAKKKKMSVSEFNRV